MTRSSEEVGWEAYRGLSTPDRRLVDAWRALGNDMVQSLLAAGVLGRQHRTHPNDATAGSPEARANTRAAAVGTVMRTRGKACEHEASHVVVARTLGLRVGRVEVRADGSGTSDIERSPDAIERLAVLLAAGEWFAVHRSDRFPEGDGSGCAQDLADAIFAGADSFNARCARRKANEILRDRRDEVIKLADRLFEAGEINLADPDR
jgi:hypothetical protein